VQVEIEKELRRQLLEVDEHSSHQARQLELLQEHTLAMRSLAPGTIVKASLPGSVSQPAGVQAPCAKGCAVPKPGE